MVYEYSYGIRYLVPWYGTVDPAHGTLHYTLDNTRLPRTKKCVH